MTSVYTVKICQAFCETEHLVEYPHLCRAFTGFSGPVLAQVSPVGPREDNILCIFNLACCIVSNYVRVRDFFEVS
jgi:hypothetical protein